MGRRSHLLFLRGGGGGEVRYWGDMKDLQGLASLTAAEQNTFIFKLFL